MDVRLALAAPSERAPPPRLRRINRPCRASCGCTGVSTFDKNITIYLQSLGYCIGNAITFPWGCLCTLHTPTTVIFSVVCLVFKMFSYPLCEADRLKKTAASAPIAVLLYVSDYVRTTKKGSAKTLLVRPTSGAYSRVAEPPLDPSYRQPPKLTADLHRPPSTLKSHNKLQLQCFVLFLAFIPSCASSCIPLCIMAQEKQKNERTDYLLPVILFLDYKKPGTSDVDVHQK